MKRLPPAKRNMLIVVAIATLAVIGLIYIFLILPQNEKNIKLAAETKSAKAKWEQCKTVIKKANDTAKQLEEISADLARTENDIASGDVYSWTYDILRRFKADYRVEIPSIGQPLPGEVDLLPGIPYKQVKITLNGSGYFHDIGKFLANFENTFPHMRIVNLQIDPNPGSSGAASEKLTFHTEVVVLVKPNP
ncbi:MAG: hypothetical protein WCH99_01365 [Verrucomicrobiota bacterium]